MFISTSASTVVYELSYNVKDRINDSMISQIVSILHSRQIETRVDRFPGQLTTSWADWTVCTKGKNNASIRITRIYWYVFLYGHLCWYIRKIEVTNAIPTKCKDCVVCNSHMKCATSVIFCKSFLFQRNIVSAKIPNSFSVKNKDGVSHKNWVNC
jgi:hypothetical protein